MRVIIELDVPEWQIGKQVEVFFPDTMMKKGVCELLKEQEAFKPEVDYICGNIVNVCGNCKSNLIARVNFCPWCGRRVAWK